MSILLAAFAALGADITPDAVNWADIAAAGSGTNANQTISGIGTAISIGASLTGSGVLSYSLNSGSFTGYSAPFSVADGDTLRWQVAKVVSAVSGTVTVANQSAGGATLDTFTYNIT